MYMKKPTTDLGTRTSSRKWKRDGDREGRWRGKEEEGESPNSVCKFLMYI
jgi:hypothetical protein